MPQLANRVQRPTSCRMIQACVNGSWYPAVCIRSEEAPDGNILADFEIFGLADLALRIRHNVPHEDMKKDAAVFWRWPPRE